MVVLLILGFYNTDFSVFVFFYAGFYLTNFRGLFFNGFYEENLQPPSPPKKKKKEKIDYKARIGF